jgi:hypothetical protein
MLLKMIANGLWFTNDQAYFKSGWNWLDVIVVILGYAKDFHALVGVLHTACFQSPFSV